MSTSLGAMAGDDVAVTVVTEGGRNGDFLMSVDGALGGYVPDGQDIAIDQSCLPVVPPDDKRSPIETSMGRWTATSIR